MSCPVLWSQDLYLTVNISSTLRRVTAHATTGAKRGLQFAKGVVLQVCIYLLRSDDACELLSP